jgi:hypothetical protein
MMAPSGDGTNSRLARRLPRLDLAEAIEFTLHPDDPQDLPLDLLLQFLGPLVVAVQLGSQLRESPA